MSEQKRITQFFAKPETKDLSNGVKRPTEHNENDETAKRTKVENKDNNNECLSPIQENRMLENQTIAQIKLQAKLTPALHPNIGPDWFKALKDEFSKPYFIKLSEFLVKERKVYTVYPAEENVFSWSHHCSVKEIKVVILGQDPYHNPHQAHGLCFSVPLGVAPPPSLINMYKELTTDVPGFMIPNHGNLTGWAQQGVLLLNASLTVRANNANSHSNYGWEQLTDAIIKYINDHNTGVVFLLWGSYAQKKGSCISKNKHHLLTTVHPSPLSAHRGFFGCRHFSKTNELLRRENRKPINWSHLPAHAR